jgi:3-dehydroquinate synthase II
VKRLWVRIQPWKKSFVTASLESGAEAIVVSEGESKKAYELGRISTVAPDGDLVPGRDVEFIEIKEKKDEVQAAGISPEKTVVLSMKDWTIIPIENILAQRSNILVEVSGVQETQLALEILEKGADGVVLNPRSINDIKKTAEVVQSIQPCIELIDAIIEEVRPLGMGDRACIDTCSNMEAGEGMLVGNTSDAFLLVHSESIENPYVAARPFRVNAGAVHAYIWTGVGKTSYLGEVETGDSITSVNAKGETRTLFVGRNKIERRPMLLVRAIAQKRPVSLVLQNAETIRLVKPSGEAMSVASIKKGDHVLAYLTEGGRHFGMKVEETLVEK